ncbi:MAG: CarD family transcriptional regulator, partial [Aquirufa sp.]
MIVKEFLSIYQSDGIVQSISDKITTSKPGESIHLKGLCGSLDTVLMSAFLKEKQPFLIICEEKEEAQYVYNDLQALIGDTAVILFPMSHKKPYEWEEVDNANVLLRAEVLNILSNYSGQSLAIVSYPAAMTEKVINRKSLVKNTLSIRVGDKIDRNFVAETLNEYDFERTDFVYEAGQYSVRGGILDVFSYAAEYPYRLDFFGDEVDSIRTFHPETQLSIQSVSAMHLIPDVQTKLIQETRESFFTFLPENTKIWIKDLSLLSDVLTENFEKGSMVYEVNSSSDINLLNKPEERWETAKTSRKSLQGFACIEYGKRSHLKNSETIVFPSKNPGAFQKDFERLATTLLDNQTHGFHNIISSESPRQLERLEVIFNEINTSIQFKPLQISLREGFVDEQTKVAFYPDHQLFERYHRYKEKNKFSKNKALTLKELRSLQVGDFVTHIDYGIGRFAGLNLVETANGEQEVIRLIYRDDDVLSVSIHSLHKISKYSGKEGAPPSMSKLGSLQSSLVSKLQAKTSLVGSTLYCLTWKQRATPGGRSISALRASARRISDNASGGLEADLTHWATPRTADTSEETWETKQARNQRHLATSLSSSRTKGVGGMTLPMMAHQTGWPTPASRDYKGESGSGRQERKDHPADTVPNAAALTGWPTPQMRDFRSGGEDRVSNPDRSNNLNDFVLMAGWPTPTVTDAARGIEYDPMAKNMTLNMAAARSGWPTAQASDGSKGSRTMDGCDAEIARKGRLSDLPSMVTWATGWPTPAASNGERAGSGITAGDHGPA